MNSTDFFFNDVSAGLSNTPKELSSKYFYDDKGSLIFQEIMQMPEYYLTNCEFEILSTQGSLIAESIPFNGPFRVIELGAGDGSKTFQLLEGMLQHQLDFTYLPIDVSAGALQSLERQVWNRKLPIKYKLLQGDYFKVLDNLSKDIPSIYLFLGANIGNYTEKGAGNLLAEVRRRMNSQDLILIGFDLKKNPNLIHRAYSDSYGITRRFNLNLLERINRELDGDFCLDQFEFYCHYNPETGEVKSYLVSLQKQSVKIRSKTFEFDRFELIQTELSKKYDLEGIEQLAHQNGFVVKQNFLDCQHYFTDSLWAKN